MYCQNLGEEYLHLKKKLTSEFFFPVLAINIDLIVFGFDTTAFFATFLSFVEAVSLFPNKKNINSISKYKKIYLLFQCQQFKICSLSVMTGGEQI